MQPSDWPVYHISVKLFVYAANSKQLITYVTYLRVDIVVYVIVSGHITVTNKCFITNGTKLS